MAKRVSWKHTTRPDDGALPVPRIEFSWHDHSVNKDWMDYQVSSCLVYKHLLRHLVVIPLCTTRVDRLSSRQLLPPWSTKEGKLLELPFRDGGDAAHLSGHLDIPVYAITPEGPVLLTFKELSVEHFIDGRLAKRG